MASNYEEVEVDFVLVSRIDDLSRQHLRSAFERVLEAEGLEIIKTVVHPFLFTSVCCPFRRLCEQAEREQLFFPLKKACEPSLPIFLLSIPRSAICIVPDSASFINAPFDNSNAHKFLHFEDEKKFFSQCQRYFLAYKILCEVEINIFVERSDGGVRSSSIIDDKPDHVKKKGLLSMLRDKAYQDYFIMHDLSDHDTDIKKTLSKFNALMDLKQSNNDATDSRLSLSRIWSNWWKFQPLHMIRNYFGEAIGFYFAFQGTFCTLLWPAAITGLAVFAYGVSKSIQYSPQLFHECFLLNSTGYSYTVPCSRKDHITQFFTAISNWTLSAFDSELTALFAVIMSIWGSVFLIMWRRNSAVLTFEWDCESIRETEEDRAEFIGTETEMDDITGEKIIVYPSWIRRLKKGASFLVVLLSMGIVMCSVLAVILFKLFALNFLQCSKEFNWVCFLCTTILPSFLNTTSTIILGMLYNKIVYRLTDWENHRTQSQHQNALIIKIFAFQFVNNYTSLFYIAFIRPEANGLQRNGLFGLGPSYKDVCEEGTCGSLLALQLIIHLVVKPFPKWFKDMVVPYFVRLTKLVRYRTKSSTEEMTIKEKLAVQGNKLFIREFIKPDPGDFVLSEMSEKAILFGTTMMFAAFFPLAPLITLIIGLIDIRMDASCLVWFNRRPIPERVAGIGIWENILTFIEYVAVLTNGFIVAFTSNFCTYFFSESIGCNFQNKLVIVLVFQNATFLLKYVLQNIISSSSSELRKSKRRRRHVARYVDVKSPEGGMNCEESVKLRDEGIQNTDL